MNNALTAQNLAGYGRGPDTMLVHMAPKEVAGLQALAMAHGGSLTINPETGLPEAGFLESLLPTLVGAGLSFIPGVGPLMAAGIVGGGTALATGSLQKGLMAGLGAYGGAGIAGGLMGAGAGAAAAAEAAAMPGMSQTALLADPTVGAGVMQSHLADAALFGDPTVAAGLTGVGGAGSLSALPVTTTGSAAAPMSAGSQMFEGAKSAFGSKAGFDQFVKGMGGGRSAAMMGLAALTPGMMAQQGLKVPTMTQSPGMIRPYTNNRTQVNRSSAPGPSGPYDSSERRYFEGMLTPGTPYAAGSQNYADGGEVSPMPRSMLEQIALRNDELTGPTAPQQDSPFARVYQTGTVPPNANFTDLERGVLQMDGFLPPPSRPPSSGPTPPSRPPSAVQPVENNPYFTMTGDSGDAFRYLMGQPAEPRYSIDPVLSPPAATPPAASNPQFDGLPQYTRDPATGRLVKIGGSESGTPGGSGGSNPAASEYDSYAALMSSGPGGANGGQVSGYASGGLGSLGGYSDGGRLLRGPGDGVSDSIPAVIGQKQPARLADGEFVVPARIVSEIGNGSTDAGARKLYAMMDRIQNARSKTVGKGRVAKDTKAEKYLPA